MTQVRIGERIRYQTGGTSRRVDPPSFDAFRAKPARNALNVSWHRRDGRHLMLHDAYVNRNEALVALELTGNPSAEDVKTAFRRLAADEHPDRGGDPGRFSNLLDARDTLMPPANALVPVSEVREIILAATSAVEERVRRAELKDETQTIVRGVVRVRTTAVRRQQRTTGLMSMMSAVIGAASQVGRFLPAHKDNTVENVVGLDSRGYRGLARAHDPAPQPEQGTDPGRHRRGGGRAG